MTEQSEQPELYEVELRELDELRRRDRIETNIFYGMAFVLIAVIGIIIFLLVSV